MSILIQTEFAKRNEILSNENKIEVRIGLHFGTVYNNEGDLFGKDVNICSRLESIAVPTSIACSENLLSELEHIDVFKREYGYVELKNIKKPIKVFKLYNDHNDYVSETQGDIDDFIKARGIKIQETDEVKKENITIGFLYPKNLGNMWGIDAPDENQFFSTEVNKQMIDYANKIRKIRTPPFETVVKYRDKELQDIAIDLSSEFLLQSSIMVTGDSFKIPSPKDWVINSSKQMLKFFDERILQ